jgi:hypothetical protein
MKTKNSIVSSFVRSCRQPKVLANVIGVTLVVCVLAMGATVQGATVLSKASNVEILLGLPSGSLEFENPLAGAERVLGHAVLEWRDADYSPGPPTWFDDWSVSDSNNISGNPTEIWMWSAGQYVWTTTTVPSPILSIHMTGDMNDGLADVSVDGKLVAQLDMFNNPGSQSALIVVRELSNTTHTIQVDATGMSPQGIDDSVHVFGAAALKENPIKWNQPPVTAHPTNLYNGWNQTSVTNDPWATWMGIAADDWVCMSPNPITKIRWWGSFMNWMSNAPPQMMPTAFQITIWTDVPTNAANPFSHPGIAIWQTHCTNFTWTFAGWDYDPRTNSVEACYLFEQNLAPGEYFTQPGGPGTIYWISIAAEYGQGTAGQNPWGWKTRPRDPLSPAPDDAVQILQPPPWQIMPGVPYMLGVPIFWPNPTNSWDLAFELISSQDLTDLKWEQLPDLKPTGININATSNAPPPNPFLLADDFRCTTPGPLTNITIWGSWRYDEFPFNPSNVVFTLSIHSDIPANPNPYSLPGPTLWWRTFTPGAYKCTVYATDLHEGWMDPPANYTPNADWTCYQYDFNIPTNLAFRQLGTPQQPVVYWLDVQANVLLGEQGYKFGWKTSITNWNDAAVWTMGSEPYNGPWNPLLYPPTHPYANSNIDLAFRLNGSTEALYEVKWSQPPVLATNGFNGWNQYSVYDTTMWVADDWACTTTNPVTDIHWWGSFIGWSEPTNPPAVPDAFDIRFWTDVPAPIGGFSHPGALLHQITCTNFTWHFVGWDFDPRNPNLPPDACFLFEQDFRTNEWFYQNPASGTNIYWVSIAAVYYFGPNVEYPWGWKSRPRDTNSLAPDDAVTFNPYGLPPTYQPIWWPNPTNSWDMAFQLTTRWPEDLDFGDAPDPGYPTLLANNGARHYVVPNFCLGTVMDTETNGLPNGNATGDDTNNLADEDGVLFLTPLLLGTQACAQVFLTSPWGSGQLDSWLDLNNNQAWEPGEKVFNNLTLLSGTNTLYFPVPTNAVLGPSGMRFRLSNAGGLLPAGPAADGEVEDYLVTIVQRRPLTNIVITNIVVTPTNVTIGWNAETNVHYQLLGATALGATNSSYWFNVGPEVIGPANSQTETNSWPAARFYRVAAPYVWP